MLLERLIENLGLEVEPFGTCGVAGGWRLRLPAQPLVALHYTLRGEGRLVVGRSTTLALAAHSLAVVPPGLAHHLEAAGGPLADDTPRMESADGLTRLRAGPEDEESLLVVCGHIRATWAGKRGLFDSLHTPLVVDLSDVPRMRHVFEALLEEQRLIRPGQTQTLAALMQQCLVELFRRICNRDDCHIPWLNALEDPRMARAMEAMHARLDRPHTLDSLAGEAAMSRSAFAARSRMVFGQTPMDYLREARLREAARLLQQPDISVDAAAARTGFASRSHFTRAFRQMFGRAPGAYRSPA